MASFLDCSISSLARCLARRASSAASAAILALLASAVSLALLMILVASSREPANSVSRSAANCSACSRAFSAPSISSLIFLARASSIDVIAPQAYFLIKTSKIKKAPLTTIMLPSIELGADSNKINGLMTTPFYSSFAIFSLIYMVDSKTKTYACSAPIKSENAVQATSSRIASGR